MTFRQRPVEVKAFQVTRDVETKAPSWFIDALKTEKAEIDRSITDGFVRVYGCTIRSPEGRMKAKIGDYIVMEPDGSLSVCKKTRFRQLYQEEKVCK